MHGKALALFSGGLDSTLAVKIMLDQGIEIEAVNFTSLFCNCNPRKEGCVHQASRAARGILGPGMEDRIGRIMARYSQDSPNGFTIERRNPDGGRTTFSVDGGLASETVEKWRVGCAGPGGNRSESGKTAG